MLFVETTKFYILLHTRTHTHMHICTHTNSQSHARMHRCARGVSCSTTMDKIKKLSQMGAVALYLLLKKLFIFSFGLLHVSIVNQWMTKLGPLCEIVDTPLCAHTQTPRHTHNQAHTNTTCTHTHTRMHARTYTTRHTQTHNMHSCIYKCITSLCSLR